MVKIFVFSLVTTLVVLSLGNGIREQLLFQKMVDYAVSSYRESDGAKNRVVMLGKPGYVGETDVYLKYLEDGYISLSGDNLSEYNGWKVLSKFDLEPGKYTLTGMSGCVENTIALQLSVSNNSGIYQYLFQYDEDVSFIIERVAEVTLYARVYPNVEGINLMARPAVYRDG